MSRGKLPVVSWPLFAGRNTGYNPEVTAGKFLLTAQNIDSYEVYRGAGKVHGSSRVTASGTGAPWKSLTFYQAENLNGDEQLRLIGVSNNRLYDVDLTSGALTVLASGYVNEQLQTVIYNDLLYMCSPNNAPRKMDMGGQESQWGINAPGLSETILESFENTSTFTVDGSNTKAFSPKYVPDLTTSTGSLQVNKLDVTTSGVHASKTGVSWNFTPAGDHTVSSFLFIPPGALNKFPASGTCAEIKVGTGGFTNSSSYLFLKGSIVEGWNQLSYIYDYPQVATGSSGTMTNITDARFSVYLNPGQTQSGFLWDHLYYFDSGAVSGTSSSGSGNPIRNSTLSYRTSYGTEYGLESNAGPISASFLVASGTATLHNLPISPDKQVTKRYLYRDLDGDQTFLRVATIYDNVTTSFIDNYGYDSLSTATPYFAQDPGGKDHTPPPKLRDAIFWQGSIVAINENQPFKLEIFSPGQPDAVVGNQALFTDLANVGLEINPNGLMVLQKQKTYRMVTNGLARDAALSLIDNEAGCVGQNAHTTVKYNILVLNSNGPYFVHAGPDNWFFGDNVKDVFAAIQDTSLEDAYIVHDFRRLQAIFFMQTIKDGPYDNILSWSYGKQEPGKIYYSNTGIAATDPRNGSWLTYKLPTSINPQSACAGLTVDYTPAIYVGGNDGHIYHLFDEATTDWAVASGTEPVEMIIETNDAPLGASASGRGRPRFIEISGDFSSSAVTNLKIVVEGRDRPNGPIISSGVMNVSISGTQSSKMWPVPGYVHGRWGRVQVTNSGAGQHPQFYSLALSYIPIGGSIAGPTQ